MTTITENLITLKKQIDLYIEKYHREKNSVRLLAASKGQSIAKIKQAMHAGQDCFGENYLQEALKKIDALKSSNIEWHFIGSIQKNKTRKIAEHFSWVHSVADLNIAQRLNEQRPSNLLPLNVCLEINISDEKTKSGLSTQDAIAFAKQCAQFENLKLRGLMAIPTPHQHFVEQREEFHKLFCLYKKIQDAGVILDTLSMGMSYDFEAAIAEGATVVRLGRSIFGERN